MSTTGWGVLAGALWLASAEALFMAIDSALEGLPLNVSVLVMGALGAAGAAAGYWAYGRGIKREEELEQEGSHLEGVNLGVD